SQESNSVSSLGNHCLWVPYQLSMVQHELDEIFTHAVDGHVASRHVCQVAMVLQDVNLSTQVVMVFLVINEPWFFRPTEDVPPAHDEELSHELALVSFQVLLHLRD